MNLPGLSTDRTKALKQQVIDAPMEVSMARAQIFTASFRRQFDQPLAVRRALAYQAVLERNPVAIYDGELLVGCLTEKRRGAFLFPEVANTWMLEQFDTLGVRPTHRFQFAPSERQRFEEEILPFWKGLSAQDRYPMYLPKEVLDLQGQSVFTVGNQFVVMLYNVDYTTVIQRGLTGIVREAEERLASTSTAVEDEDRTKQFYRSVVIACQAVIAFANRYADLAEQLAKEAGPGPRRDELLTIANICRRVPAFPARTFREGLQAVWFAFLGLLLDDGQSELPFGRLDQVLAPLYTADLARGDLDRAAALELLEAFVIKATEVVFLLDNGASLAEDGNTGRLTVTIGGVDEDGRDATNEVSYLLLEAVERARTIQPNLAVRLHAGSPPAFIQQVTDLMTSGANNLEVVNDEAIATGMMEGGIPAPDARDYIITGCVQPAAAKTYGSTCAAHLNGPKTLELMLSELAKAEAFARYGSFDDFYRKYKELSSSYVQATLAAVEAVDRAFDELLPNPFVSALIDGTLTSGKDVKSGGATHNLSGINVLGIGTLADSLAAIEELVFTKKMISLPDLVSALRQDFAGHEPTRQLLLTRAAKYGNDDDRVDQIARQLLDFFQQEISTRKTYRGGQYVLGAHSEAAHVLFGLLTGATPDGRHARQPLSVGAGPTSGIETEGYLATLHSVGKIKPTRCLGGTSVNLRFHPQLFLQPVYREKFASTLLTYFFDLKGQHLQINVVSTETLRDAQAHPENYGDLLVRVSGYSARFIDLTKATQDEIIARNEQMTVGR